MNELLPKWYKSVTLSNINGETFKKRITDIKKIVKSKNIDWLYDCVRIYLGKPIDNDIVINELKKVFGSSDSFFYQNDSALELQILCGAIVFETVFNSSKESRFKLALTIDSATFNMSNTIVNSDIVEKIHAFIDLEGDRIRNKELESPPDVLVEFNSEVTEASAIPLTKKFKELSDQINEKYKQLLQKINAAYKTINFLREESNLLWWTFGSYSDGQLRNEIDKYSFPFIIGEELSNLITTIPPAQVSYQFLRKVINTTNHDLVNEPISNFINGINIDLCAKIASTYDNKLSNLLPIHFAIFKRKENGNENAWTNAFENQCLIKADSKVAIFEFTKQFIVERLILKSK